MSILLDQNTRILIQGITGKEGQRSAEWIMAYSPETLVAGVTPGKGGETVAGRPVYNSVAEAMAAHPEINASSIYAPPRFALAAVQEALTARLPLVHILAEEVPLRDSVEMLMLAQQTGTRLIGPASIGLIAPGKAKLGSIGGPENQQFQPGSIGIVSKSGGMTSEVALQLSRNGFGQSTAIGIGGNVIAGTTFADLVDDFEADPQTKAVVIIGEIGGSYEEQLAAKLQTLSSHKLYIAFISGRFAQTLPQGMSFGHAGAIVDKEVGTLESKQHALQTAGVHLVNEPSAIINILRENLTTDF